MEIKEYLINKQPIVYQVIQNSFKSNKTSHAYIIAGCKGLPIKETAILLAKSFICNKDDDGLACEVCDDCKRIENNTYADFIYIEGKDLKANAILNIQDNFSKAAMENAGIKIYVINLIENASDESLNKLLKFIEEPASNIIAIFTSNSVSSILPTIVSRCQVITLKEFKVQDIANYLIENGVYEEDAMMISKVSNNAEGNLELVNTEKYVIVKEVLTKSLTYLSNNDDMLIVYMQTEGFKKLDEYDGFDLYLDMLEATLLESLIKKEDNSYTPCFFVESISKIANMYNFIDKMIIDVSTAKIELLSNTNKSLSLDKMLINLLRR